MKKTVTTFIILSVCLAISNVSWGTDHLGGIDIHGFISQGYLKSTEDQEYMAYGIKDGTFQFNEMGINFSTNVTDELRIGTQFMAFDLGHLGNDEIILDWAFADYRYEDWLGLRAGLIKIAHGLYNETRDVDLLRTNVFLPASVYGELFRDAFTRMKGVGIYGLLPFGISYQAIYGATTVETDGGLVEAFESLLYMEASSVEVGNAYNLNIQWLTPVDNLKFGGSIYAIDTFKINGAVVSNPESDKLKLIAGRDINLDFETIQATVFSFEYLLENLVFSAEYTQDKLEFSYNLSPDTKLMPFDFVMEGYYFRMSYRFTDWFECGLLYSELYFDKDDKSGREMAKQGVAKYKADAYLKDTGLSLRFDLNSNWLIKLEAHYMNGTFLVVGPPLSDEYEWQFYAAKFTYSF